MIRRKNRVKMTVVTREEIVAARDIIPAFGYGRGFGSKDVRWSEFPNNKEFYLSFQGMSKSRFYLAITLKDDPNLLAYSIGFVPEGVMAVLEPKP